MQNPLFREKSLTRISSPEELHDYMRVTSPRLWMILSAIVILLAGFIVYASVTTMENTMAIRVQVENYTVHDEDNPEEDGRQYTVVSCTLPASELATVKTGMTVRLGEEEGKISLIAASADSDEITVAIDMDHGRLPFPDGEYPAELVLEKTTPISFLWN